ncbi:MAG: DUF6876 family protein [Methyloligellaceae bacterium]
MDKLTQSDLDQFIGTTIWYKHGLVKNVTYTEGVLYVAKTAGAYWLIDEIAFAQLEPEVSVESFQLWILKVDHQQAARLICEDGNGELIREKLIEFTDFPLPELRLYFTDDVIMLPSEY